MPKWKDVPRDRLIQLLDATLHSHDLCDPEWIADTFGIPLKLLPVVEVMVDRSCGPIIELDGKRVLHAHAVSAGDLFEAIADGLGMDRPKCARRDVRGWRKFADSLAQRLKDE